MNPHLQSLPSDFLYHLGYGKADAKELFGDVKFIVTGGSSGRMKCFAMQIAEAIGHHQREIKDLDRTKTDRFSFYKIGPVIAISHGMGVPSITILLHEILKLLHYAEAVDPIIIRIGTSGGIGVDPGTVVITNKAVNGFYKEFHDVVILGKTVSRSSKMDKQLAEDILGAQKEDRFCTMLGTTMCTNDFYEGQGRIDGAVCEFSKDERQSYLKEVHKNGVVNIEMEATALASLCHKAGVKCAVVCVTLLDRLEGDQVDLLPEVYKDFQSRPLNLVTEYIKQTLMK